MATNKKVIDFLNYARPTILDLTNDNVKIIEKDKELMKILKSTATDFENGYGDIVGANTNLSAYHSMGWYLAESLRNDIQNYYRIKYGITMAEFLRKKYGDEFTIPSYMYTEFNQKYIKEEYKRYFGRELILS